MITEKYVYFTKELTVDEEYKIINESKELKVEIPAQLAYGASLLKSNTLYMSEDFELTKYTNERYFFVLISMVSSPPFYNMLLNMENKKKRILPFGASLLKFLREKHVGGQFVGLGYSKIYNQICYKLHDELIKCYFFDEKEWKEDVAIEKNPVFKEYSPIVELFHIKTKKRYPELIKIDYNEDIKVNDSIKAAILEFIGDKEVERAPYTLVFTVNNENAIEIPKEISLSNNHYTLNSFIKKDSVFYKINGQWYYGHDYKITKINEIPSSDIVQMVFYTLKKD